LDFARFSLSAAAAAAALRPSPARRDDSLHTFVGHTVTQTLIRADFSPAVSTAHRYIYSGSSSGDVFVWSTLDGQLVDVLANAHGAIVRDVSWHPMLPVLATASVRVCLFAAVVASHVRFVVVFSHICRSAGLCLCLFSFSLRYGMVAWRGVGRSVDGAGVLVSCRATLIASLS
jgi:hypothetical protein